MNISQFYSNPCVAILGAGIKDDGNYRVRFRKKKKKQFFTKRNIIRLVIHEN